MRVLDTLTEGPTERYDIEEETGVARATLGRILDDLWERGWVTRDAREYETTEVGDFIVKEFLGLLERTATIRDLSEIAQLFPEEEYGFDLGHLSTAMIVRATKRDATALVMHLHREIEGA